MSKQVGTRLLGSQSVYVDATLVILEKRMILSSMQVQKFTSKSKYAVSLSNTENRIFQESVGRVFISDKSTHTCSCSDRKES